MNRIWVDETPDVRVPPPVTDRVAVRPPVPEKAYWTVLPLSVGPPFEKTQEKVAAGSGSLAAKVIVRPDSASQFPLNWFCVAPVSV